ncbi:hypothetical protein LCGC14_1713550 [marine sediment metagenome]|uniref:DUF2158 domain-containing protein n=1 Tax=marine sediment metagenome TaxID=412755 RepID=A0A0F9KEG6_9ZZZZ
MKVGYVVRLKSGGPQMTVNQIFSDVATASTIECFWFNYDEVRLHGNFAPDALELVNES